MVGVGTSVHILLPRVEAPSEAEAPINAPAALKRSSRAHRVLLVDDNKKVLEAQAEALNIKDQLRGTLTDRELLRRQVEEQQNARDEVVRKLVTKSAKEGLRAQKRRQLLIAVGIAIGVSLASLLSQSPKHRFFCQGSSVASSCRCGISGSPCFHWCLERS